MNLQRWMRCLPEMKKIKVELVRLKFGDSVLHKYRPSGYCCGTVTKNETVEFTTESSAGDYSVYDDDNFTLPHLSPRFIRTEKGGEDEQESNCYCPTEFCPHCDEKTEIVVIGKKDRTERYLELKKQGDDL